MLSDTSLNPEASFCSQAFHGTDQQASKQAEENFAVYLDFSLHFSCT